MAQLRTGATYGDAIIALSQFAERHPYRFLLTVPGTAALALLIAALGLKVIVLGPLTHHMDKYESVRQRARNHDERRNP